MLGLLPLVSDFLFGSFFCLLAAAGVFSLFPLEVLLVLAGVIFLTLAGMAVSLATGVSSSLAGSCIAKPYFQAEGSDLSDACSSHETQCFLRH